MFQHALLQSRIDAQAERIKSAYERYGAYFLNADIQRNIRCSKEEQFQEGFLRELFVNVLGYTLNPDADYNLITEKKNETDAKKADGAILVGGTVHGVIELKDTRTTDLKSVEPQAFGYKYHHRKAVYVIVSNFEKLRFYIDNALDFLEWNLFTLTENQFAVLYLCLAWENIVIGLPKQLQTESVSNEDDITRRFYADYSQFKRVLFEDLIANNTGLDQLTLFKAAQKILDRILFLCFAEDANLIPANIIFKLTQEWKQLDQLDEYRPLYQYFQKYFVYLDKGSRGKPHDIFGYNGGLFKPDAALDRLIVSDNVLENHSLHLSQYNFHSEIDVNILGHIFEHSLSEIEEIEKQLVKEPEAKQSGTSGLETSKRKKDGIFYTPRYITAYLVESTLGKLCNEKKQELGLVDSGQWIADSGKPEKIKSRSKSKNCPLSTINYQLSTYREWLLSLTICDPACGSGAFLNAALDFLKREHRFIDEWEAKIHDRPFMETEVEKEILEKNLYGVDINEESVEITRLALWLRTAKKRRQLNFLDNNIKCGNSLRSDSFDWHAEFPQVFANGGFDIVIGNPPYFNIQTLGAGSEQAQWIQQHYPEVWQDKSDILFYFLYKSLQISKSEVGMIVSNAFLFSDKAQKLRNVLLEDGRLAKIVNFEQYQVFDDASITTAMVIFNKTHADTQAVVLKKRKYSVDEINEIIDDKANAFTVNFKPNDVFALIDNRVAALNEKIDGNHPPLRDVCKVGKGMETAANEVFLFQQFPEQFDKEFVKKRMSGEIINRYSLGAAFEYLLYFEDVETFGELPKTIQKHLSANKEFLENRADKKRRATAPWWNYTFPMHKECYHLPKIWCSYRSKNNAFVLDESSDYIGLTNTTVIFDTNKEVSLKYVLALLNSKLLDFRYKSIGKQTGSGVYEYFENGVGKLPIPMIDKKSQKPFIVLAEKMISLYSDLQTQRGKFLRLLPANVKGMKITPPLEHFEELDFPALLEEFQKQDKAIPKKEQPEWEEFFEERRTLCRNVRKQIAETDKKIDQNVYDLYGLSVDDVKIIEC